MRLPSCFWEANRAAAPMASEPVALEEAPMTEQFWFYERGEGESESRPLTMKSLMSTHPLVLHPDQVVLDAITLMRERDVRHIPIVTRDGGRLVGLITEVDILRNVLHGKKMTKEENYHSTLDVMLPLEEAMVTGLETLPPDAPVGDAIALFLEHKIRCVPIVDARQRLLGIVTETDLMKLLRHMVRP